MNSKRQFYKFILLVTITLANIHAQQNLEQVQFASSNDEVTKTRQNFIDTIVELREQLVDNGISFVGQYTYEYTHVLDGGIRRDGSGRNLFTFDTEIDLEKISGLEGATLFAQFLHVNAERGGVSYTGDIQGYTNIESERSLDVLYELWYQQEFLDGKYRLKIGKVDANSEFDFINSAGNFANSSAGSSPTIFPLPTYPNSAMSANIFARFLDTEAVDITIGYGFYDGSATVDGVETGRLGPKTFFADNRSNDYFQVLQGEFNWDSMGALDEGVLRMGAWYHSGNFKTYSGNKNKGTQGIFVNWEQRLTTRDDDTAEGLYVFGQYGSSDENISDISQHVSLGLITDGVTQGRTNDSAGIYISYVDLSDNAMANDGKGYAKNEWAIDLFYRFQLHENIALQPEIQYIINPSGSAIIEDALAAGLRFISEF